MNIDFYLKVINYRISPVLANPILVSYFRKNFYENFKDLCIDEDYFAENEYNLSVPYEIELESGNQKSNISDLAKLDWSPIKSIIIFHCGVGTMPDSGYNNFCQRLSKDLNALVVVPVFSCGTMIYYYDKNRKLQPYNYSVSMFTNSKERMEQNDVRGEETFEIVEEIWKNIPKPANGMGDDRLDPIPTYAIGHSFGGCSSFHLLANPEKVSKYFKKIVSLGCSIGVGITDRDWKEIFKMEYSTQALQIYEGQWDRKAFRQNSIFARTHLVDEKLNAATPKHFVRTVANSNHGDLWDYLCKDKSQMKTANKKITIN